MKKLTNFIVLFFCAITIAKTQPGLTCPTPDTLVQVPAGGNFSNISFASGQMSFYLTFVAVDDTLDFDIDTNTTNPAILTQFTLIENNCLGSIIYTHNYSGTESFSATGLTIGERYYIRLDRTNSGTVNQFII